MTGAMRVRVLTTGSQGDVRPYVALGAGLQAAGHDVRIVAHPGFEGLVRRKGLDFAPIAGDPRDLAASGNAEARALHDRGRSLVRWWRAIKEIDAPLMRQRLRDTWDACQDADVIVTSTLPYLFGYAAAMKRQVPLVRAFYFPVSPTRAYPIEALPRWPPLGGAVNLASYHVQRQLLWQVARPLMAGACRDVLGLRGLPRLEPFGDLDRRQQLLLYAYSPAVAPPPPDWGPWIDVTGYWFLDRATAWTPPPALAAFLEDGPPPICIGFGSMLYDRAELVRIVQQTLDATGQRAVLLMGWGGLRPEELPRNLIAIEWLPLNWLFPRVSAVVHHGGAGTTAEGLRAGVPTVVVPFFYDQFLWARRVHALGAGPAPIPRRHLSAGRLTAAIREATSNTEMRRRAGEVGRRIRSEDGIGRAVAAFDRHLRRVGGGAEAPVQGAGRSVPAGSTPA
jgi:sterol 3beta-glucosyltransferase